MDLKNAEMTEKPEEAEAFLRQARERMRRAKDAWQENHKEAREDADFLSGDQWPEAVRRAREQDHRPCLTINRLPGFLDQVVGDQRQNRPQIKVRPTESGDQDVAEVFEGLCRNIEAQSCAEDAYDGAFEQAAGCGFGFLRVLTEYSADDSFEQDIRVKHIMDPFSVLMDPDAEGKTYEDANWCFITSIMEKKAFEREYPNKKGGDALESTETGRADWWTGDRIIIAEYFYREPYTKTLYLFADGSVAEKLPPPEATDAPGVVRKREVKCHRIKWCKISGGDILEGPQDWAGKHIPVIPVLGKEYVRKGKREFRGLVRFARDPQRMFNYWRTAETEMVALAPKAPYLATPHQIEGHEDQWRNATTTPQSVLLYNDDGRTSRPTREPAPQIPAGMVQMALEAADDMKATTGIYDASLGARSNEQSGRAIMARQREGDTATFAFIDNLARSIRQVGRVLIDLIPRVYDTERVVRVLGADGKGEMARVNSPEYDPQSGMWRVLNDLSAGEYDVAVVTGPSFTTQRQEAADFLTEILRGNPGLMGSIGDLLFKNMDLPGSADVAKRLEKMVPPQLREGEPGAEEDAPPEQPPDPLQELDVKSKELDLDKKALEVRKLAAEIGMIPGLSQIVAQQVQEQLAALLGQPTQVEDAPGLEILDAPPLTMRQFTPPYMEGQDDAGSPL